VVENWPEIILERAKRKNKRIYRLLREIRDLRKEEKRSAIEKLPRRLGKLRYELYLSSNCAKDTADELSVEETKAKRKAEI
jgi:hypothetical protein